MKMVMERVRAREGELEPALKRQARDSSPPIQSHRHIPLATSYSLLIPLDRTDPTDRITPSQTLFQVTFSIQLMSVDPKRAWTTVAGYFSRMGSWFESEERKDKVSVRMI